jgi:hypothetical protein
MLKDQIIETLITEQTASVFGQHLVQIEKVAKRLAEDIPQMNIEDLIVKLRDEAHDHSVIVAREIVKFQQFMSSEIAKTIGSYEQVEVAA